MSCLQRKFAYIDNSPSKFEPCGDYRAEMFWEAFEKALPSSDLEVHLSRYSFLEVDYSLTKTLLCAWCVIVGDPQKKEDEREERCALFGRSVAWVLINNVPSEVLRVALKKRMVQHHSYPPVLGKLLWKNSLPSYKMQSSSSFENGVSSTTNC